MKEDGGPIDSLTLNKLHRISVYMMNRTISFWKIELYLLGWNDCGFLVAVWCYLWMKSLRLPHLLAVHRGLRTVIIIIVVIIITIITIIILLLNITITIITSISFSPLSNNKVHFSLRFARDSWLKVLKAGLMLDNTWIRTIWQSLI